MQQSDPDTLVTLYNQPIICMLDKHVLSRTIALKGNGLKPWYDEEAGGIRRRLERQYSKSKLEIHRQLLKEQV